MIFMTHGLTTARVPIQYLVIDLQWCLLISNHTKCLKYMIQLKRTSYIARPVPMTAWQYNKVILFFKKNYYCANLKKSVTHISQTNKQKYHN